MGCIQSIKNSKVAPAVVIASPPSKNTNGNQVRGDRLSIVDARQKREDESRERRKRLSSLVPAEVNKVTSRRNSSRIGSTEEHNNRKSSTPTLTNGTSKKHEIGEAEKVSNSYRNKEDTKIEINSNEKENKNSRVLIIDSDDENQRNTSQLDKEKYTSNGKVSPKTSPHTNHTIRVEPWRDYPRISEESMELKQNADSFVNSIMSNALIIVEKDKTKMEDNERSHDGNKTQSPSASSLRTSSPLNTNRSGNSTNVDEHAKDIVGNVLNSALFQFKNENNNASL